MSLDKRIALKRNANEKVIVQAQKKRDVNRVEKIDALIREYSASTDLVSMDWKKVKIPPVLPSSEHAWLFKLMEPMKVNYFLVLVSNSYSFMIFFPSQTPLIFECQRTLQPKSLIRKIMTFN